MKIRFLILFFLALAVQATAHPFALCMYGVNKPEYVPVIKKAGFTCFQSYQKNPEKLAPLAEAAAKYGLQVMFHPQEVIDSEYQEEAQNWPVLAWYLVDEPDVWKAGRARVKESHQISKSVFPNHPTSLVIGQGKTAIPYYDLSDILMMDWYPVPHLALTSFGDNVRWHRSSGCTHRIGKTRFAGTIST